MASVLRMFRKLQDQITCIICANCLSESVTMECGHSFCRECLLWSWEVGDTRFSCPECRQVSQIGECPALNVSLENLSDIGKRLSSLGLKRNEGQSPEIQEILELFGEEDETPLCGPSLQTPEDGVLEEAVCYYGEKLRKIENYLKKDKGPKNLLSQEKEALGDLN